jgi:hypothetical protein
VDLLRVSSLMRGPTTTPGSNLGPTRSFRTASTKRGMKRSAMVSWTKIRFDEHAVLVGHRIPSRPFPG